MSKVKILIVDDEDLVRKLLVAYAVMLGYEAHSASTSRQAISLFKEAVELNQRYNLIVLDYVLPDMFGNETLQRLRALDANVNALIVSGQTNDDIGMSSHTPGFVGFLLKPFTIEEFQLAVEKTLFT